MSDEIVKIAGGVILGVFTVILYPIIKDKLNVLITKKQESPRVLFEIEDISKEIKSAISYQPHKVHNKAAWVTRLNNYADGNKDNLDELQHTIKKIAWRIEDSNFDHDPNNIVYCCDELKIDLTLLQFALLEKKLKQQGMSEQKITSEELEFIKANWSDFQKKVINRFLPYLEDDVQFATRVESFRERLKKGTIELPEHMAMASYFKKRSTAAT